MKMWIIVAVIAGLLLFAGIALVKANVQSEDVKQPSKVASCGCENSCTKDNKCSLATCGATQGKTCSCNKG